MRGVVARTLHVLLQEAMFVLSGKKAWADIEDDEAARCLKFEVLKKGQ